MDLSELKTKSTDDLSELAADRGIANPSKMRRQELVLAILRDEARRGQVRGSGVLEVLADGFGFLRAPDSNYTPGPDDIYVSPSQIRRFHLRTGDTVAGVVRPPKENERYYALLKVETINDQSPEDRKKNLFDNLVAVYPDTPVKLEFDPADQLTRIIDLFCPLGFGGRALVVAPPRAGKSALLRSIARAVATNHPDVDVQIVLIGERPEEITEMQRSTDGSVLSSSFDEPASRHVQVADLVLERAKRTAESGGDAFILVDSMSRLARAYAAVADPPVASDDPSVLHKCKRFFGAARNLDNGGSVTVVATASDGASSTADAALADELREAANTVLVLDRDLLDRRVFPCVDLHRSQTRRLDRILDAERLAALDKLRDSQSELEPAAAVKKIREALAEHSTNAELLAAL
jgi:transcription termination factor Rho